MKVLDLFCGAGGLAYGFSKAGFRVTGVDISEIAGKAFEFHTGGKFIKADLSREIIDDDDYDVIIGGPPCKPWSSVNITKRGKDHDDYHLLSRFFKHVEHHSPRMFILENVKPLANDEILQKHIRRLQKQKWSVLPKIVKYSDYGAPTKRHRLIVVGIMDGNAETFFKLLSRSRKTAKTVRDVIWYLKDKERDEIPDHVWPELKTINRYRNYYRTEKYGWYRLRWKEPAPSFGNIMKTYILHPDAFNGGVTRVISVKEASRIMGFNKGFHFPEGGLGVRYQMVADSVSPRFSVVTTRITEKLLVDGGKH